MSFKKIRTWRVFGWLGFEFCDEIEDEISHHKDVKDLEKDPKTELISSFIDVYRWLQRWKYNKDRFNRVCNRVCFHVSLFPLMCLISHRVFFPTGNLQ